MRPAVLRKATARSLPLETPDLGDGRKAAKVGRCLPTDNLNCRLKAYT